MDNEHSNPSDRPDVEDTSETDTSGEQRFIVGGRPRDPRIDRVIREVAVELYAESGWAGFQISTIAKRAGVGKSAIYRRWPTLEDLLIDSIRGMDTRAVVGDAETLRQALCNLALEQLEWWGNTPGTAYLRLQVDQVNYPVLGELYSARVRGPLLEVAREQVAKAIESGEVPRGTSTLLLVEMLSGAMMMRMGSSSGPDRQKLLDNPQPYVQRLVDHALASTSVAPAQPEGPAPPGH
jgi:AcrR family transcriptional regulator